MSDNVNIPVVGTGDTGPVPIAADEISGVKWQRMKLAVGPDGQAVDSSAIARVPVSVPTKSIGARHPPEAYVLDVEDFRNPVPGVWNDGVGLASRDTEISLGGLPCLRMDTQGQSASPPSPAAPSAPGAAAVVGGGTFAAGTYFWKVTGVATHGEGVASAEVSATIALNGSATISWTGVDGYIGYNVYRGTITGGEQFVAFVSGRATASYLDTGTATNPAITPPGATTAINPGRTAVTGGVVVKRRIHDNFTDVFGLASWFRLTSSNNTSNVFPTLSVYNRDGASAYHGRLWLRPQGNNLPIDVLVLDGAETILANTVPLTGGGASWTKVGTSLLQNGSGTHLYEPFSGRMDRAGGWHYCKLIIDFANLKYVSCQIDGEAPIDCSAYNLDKTTTSGFAGMHLSWEYCATTSTPRYMHTARWVITKETLL